MNPIVDNAYMLYSIRNLSQILFSFMLPSTVPTVGVKQ